MTGPARYEGRVICVEGDIFTAELTDMVNRSVVHADMAMSVLSGAKRVEPGDILDVVVGAVGEPSTVKLRHLGYWTEAEVQAIRDRAERRCAHMSFR